MPTVSPKIFKSLTEFVGSKRNILVISGAGCSTDSGIPDYRDTNGKWKPDNRPIQHQDFVASVSTRQRYWARSLIGWEHFGGSEPNSAHIALTKLQGFGRVGTIVTQNVDRLHQLAGSEDVVDLHGRLDQVVCLKCKEIGSREGIQDWLIKNNPHFAQQDVGIAPDGDAALDGEFNDFQIPICESCGGVMKPNVVFFGDNVPREKVTQVFTQLSEADGLLIVGSSLMVFSGYRFVRRAHEMQMPIAAINQGVTRADDLIDLKIEASCSKVLSEIIQHM